MKKIYSSPDLQNIPLEEFIKELSENQLIFHEIEDIDVNIDIDCDLRGSMGILTSISLIVTELILNTISYAFEEEGETEKSLNYLLKKKEIKSI